MSRSKAPKPTLVQQPTPPEQGDDEVESDVEYGQEGGRLKDVTELELDRLVFGDSAGFRAELGDIELQEGVEQGADEDTGLGGLDDADVGQAVLHTQCQARWLTRAALLHRHWRCGYDTAEYT